MAINFRSLKENIASVIVSLSSKVVIWSDQNAPTPDGDYIALKITSTRFIGGTDWQSKPNADEESETQGDRELVLSVICVSENSMEILLDLIDKLNLNSTLDLLGSKKLAYVDLESDAIDITTNIDSAFESRASMELIFRISKNYSSETVDAVNKVNKIGIEGEVEGENSEDPFIFSMTVE